MTTLTCDFLTVTGAGIGDTAALTVATPRMAHDGTAVILPEEVSAPVDELGTAVFTDVDPGPVVVTLRRQCRSSAVFPVVVPDESEVTLADLLESRYPYTPAQISAAREAAAVAEEKAREAETAAAAAGGAADRAEAARDHAVTAAQTATAHDWKPHSEVAAGQRVIAPTGETVVATSTQATPATWDASNFEGFAPTIHTMEIYEAKSDAMKKVVFQETSDILYAVTQDATATVWKTTDGGQTWNARGPIGVSILSMTKIQGTGTLIAVQKTSRGAVGLSPKVMRSADDGLTWTEVTTLRFPGLGPQGVLSPANGVILAAEYGNVAGEVYSVKRSADDGLTWENVLSSPGTDPRHDPGHIHSVVQDPVTGTIIAFMDRPNPEIYISDDSGATWTLLKSSTETYHPNWVAPMFFDEWVAWGNDNDADGRVYRLRRDDFYAGRWDSPEIVAKLGNSRFYGAHPIRPGAWLMAGAVEPVNPTYHHAYSPRLYVVDMEGARVSGALAVSIPLPNITGLNTGTRVELPGHPSDLPNFGGHTWINVPTNDLPREFSMVPATVGRDPVMPRVQTGAVGSFLLPTGAAIRFVNPSGGVRSALSGPPGGEVLLGDLTSGNYVATHPNSAGVRFHVGGQIKGDFKAEGLLLRKSPIHLNTNADGPAIQTGQGDPNGVVAARWGSLYLDYGTPRALWQRTGGAAALGSDGWTMLVGQAQVLAAGVFTSAASTLNTVGKFPGKQAVESGANRLLIAHGAAPTDPWGDASGAVVYTPA